MANLEERERDSHLKEYFMPQNLPGEIDENK
jgi:hypothetical protein